jgi:hypothetical protein
VVAAAANAVGVKEEVNGALADNLADYLHRRRGLLVLDNAPS